MRKTQQIGEVDEREKDWIIRAMKAKNIKDMLKEVEVPIDTIFYDEFLEMKSLLFLNKIVSNQGLVETRLLKKTRKATNCSPKTMKVIGENQENIICVGKRREMMTRKKTDSKCWCIKAGLPLTAKHSS